MAFVVRRCFSMVFVGESTVVSVVWEGGGRGVSVVSLSFVLFV